MAERLQSEFRDDAGTLWRVQIIDSEYSGAVKDFTCGPDGFTLRYQGDTAQTHDPIIGSTVDVTLMSLSGDHLDLFDDLNDLEETQILLRIDRFNAVTGFTLYWSGYVLAEQTVVADIHEPTPVKLRAACGLARLKDELYKDASGPYTGTQTLLEVVLNCLPEFSQQFYGTGTYDAFLRVVPYVEDVNHPGSQSEHLSVSRVEAATFFKPDRTGDERYYSKLEVLRSIAMAFTARVFLSAGRWWFFPPAQVIVSAQIDAPAFKKNGAASADLLIPITNYDVRVSETATGKRKRGWQKSYLVPLHKVRRTQRYNGNVPLWRRNLIANSDFPAQFEDQDRTYPSGTKFRIQGNITYQNVGDTATGNATVRRVEVRVYCQVGSKYLKRTITYSGTAQNFHITTGTGVEYTQSNIGGSSWGNQAQDYYAVISPIFNSTEDQTVNTAIQIPFNFVTPPLPSEQAEMDVTIQAYTVDNNGTATAATVQQTGQMFRADVEGEEPGDTIIWQSVNDANSTEVLEQGECLIGDTVTDSGLGTIQIYNGSIWTDQTEWITPHILVGTFLHSIGVQTVIRFQQDPHKTRRGTLSGLEFYMHQIFSYESAVYVPHTITYEARNLETAFDGFRVRFNNDFSVTLDEYDPQSDVKGEPNTGGSTSGSNAANIERISGLVSGVDGAVNDIVNDVAANAGDIATLQTDVSNQAASISSNATNIGSNDTDIDDLQKTLKGDSGTSLGVFSDTADVTASGLLVQSSESKLQGGDNTNLTAAQSSPGTIEMNVQAWTGAAGSEAQVTALSIVGSSASSTKATVNIQSGDCRFTNTPVQFNANSPATFLGTTTGISHDDLDDRPPLYHGIGLDAAGTGGFFIGSGTVTFAVGDLFTFTYDQYAGIYQCITAVTIDQETTATSVTTNWLANANKFQHVGARGDLSLGSLDSSTASDSFSDSLSTFTLTCSSTITLQSSTLIGLFGTVFSTGNITAAGLSTTGTGTIGTLVASSLNYPTSDGTSGQAITTDGAGNLSFSTISGGGGGSARTVMLNYGFFDNNVRNVFIPLTNETETTSRQRYNVFVPTSAGEVKKFSMFVTGSKSGGTGGSIAVQKMTGTVSYTTLDTQTFSSLTGYSPTVLTFSGATFNAGDRIYFFFTNGFGSAIFNMMGAIEIEYT